jgi:hypothetical protein
MQRNHLVVPYSSVRLARLLIQQKLENEGVKYNLGQIYGMAMAEKAERDLNKILTANEKEAGDGIRS